MSWLLPRLMLLLAAVALGALVGGLIGDFEALGVVAGGALVGLGVAASMVVRDGVHLHAMAQWLQAGGDTSALRQAGLWGELAYRVERELLLRERAAQQAGARLSQWLTAIEASPNGVVLLDASDQIEWCSAVAADHLGLDPVRDVRQPMTNLVRSPAFVAYLQGGLYTEPVKFPSPDGQATLQVLARPYGDGLKLVLTQDITERERADAMRRDFVANVSHEIRTPLTVLAGFVETMANLPLTEVERRRVLLLMQQQTGRMQTLVGDLLTLARLEGSPRPPADRWVQVDRLVALAEAEGRALSAGRHPLEVRVDSVAEVAGVEAEITSALTNLVNNAVRYTPDGGRIELTWRVRDDGSGEFSIRDAGIGIAAEHIPRLTERFYRVDGSRSRDTGGTGLGLSIVKHVAQRHAGELQVDSEPGHGSTFRLILPPARVRVDLTAPVAEALPTPAAEAARP